jgi:hypothetical protein
MIIPDKYGSRLLLPRDESLVQQESPAPLLLLRALQSFARLIFDAEVDSGSIETPDEVSNIRGIVT